MPADPRFLLQNASSLYPILLSCCSYCMCGCVNFPMLDFSEVRAQKDSGRENLLQSTGQIDIT